MQKRIWEHQKLEVYHPGTKSPIEPVEPLLVHMLLQIQSFQLAMKVKQGIWLANLLVEGTEHKDRVIHFKEKFGL